MVYNHLVIDGRNLLYRSIFAAHGDSGFLSTGKSPTVIFLRSINKLLGSYAPQQLHIIWDGHNAGHWRREYLSQSQAYKHITVGYKEQRGDKIDTYNFDVYTILQKCMRECYHLLHYIGARQYNRAYIEADDLIYAFCKLVPSSETVAIVSSDSDLDQLISLNIHRINPLSKEITMSKCPLNSSPIFKALVGDKADNIMGYYQIGKKKGEKLTADVKLRTQFLSSDKARIKIDGKLIHVGYNLYKTNLQIIDLSFHPSVNNNLWYIEHKRSTPVKHSNKKLESIIHKLNIPGLITEEFLLHNLTSVASTLT